MLFVYARAYIYYKGIDADSKNKKIIIFCKISAKIFGSLKKMLYLCNTEIKQKTMDKNKTLNTEFNEVYDAISKAYEAINEFYMKHYFAQSSETDDRYARYGVENLLDSMGNVKEEAHDLAEHFTWDR